MALEQKYAAQVDVSILGSEQYGSVLTSAETRLAFGAMLQILFWRIYRWGFGEKLIRIIGAIIRKYRQE